MNSLLCTSNQNVFFTVSAGVSVQAITGHIKQKQIFSAQVHASCLECKSVHIVFTGPVLLYVPLKFVETISSKQSELDTFIAEGYKTALSEERRRYCFLVDRQCAVAKNSSAYHGKVSPRVPSPPRE